MIKNVAKKITAITVSAVTLLSPLVVEASSFSDVSDSSYYSAPVKWAVENGIANGTGNGMFSPNKVCTRGQVVTFLYNWLGNGKKVTGYNFSDVKQGDYYYYPVEWAVSWTYAQGKSKEYFGANEPCTRAQAMQMMFGAAGDSTGKLYSTQFTDVSEDAYYARAVCWAIDNHVTTGKSATKFDPNDVCTRGQIVTFIYNYLFGGTAETGNSTNSLADGYYEKDMKTKDFDLTTDYLMITTDFSYSKSGDFEDATTVSGSYKIPLSNSAKYSWSDGAAGAHPLSFSDFKQMMQKYYYMGCRIHIQNGQIVSMNMHS